MVHKIWSDFGVSPEDNPDSIRQKLERRLEQLLSEANFDESVKRLLSEAKRVIECSGGDWDTGYKSIQGILDNLRESIKHSMIPESIISQLPPTL